LCSKNGGYLAAIQFKGVQDTAHIAEIAALIFPGTFENGEQVSGIAVANTWKEVKVGDWIVKPPSNDIIIVANDVFYATYYVIPDAPTSEAPKEDKSYESFKS
jgi:hypothetical protein